MSEYPLSKFHFQVSWDGSRFGFQEISGLNVETEMIEYRDGLSPEYSNIKMPGMHKNNNITLKKGMFKGDNKFYDWWNTVQMNKINRKDVTINLLNENHEPVVTWRIRNAWPVKVNSADLKADGNEVAIETMELAHEGIVIEYN